MDNPDSVGTKQRYSLTDIDSRLEYITELAEALGVDPNKIMSDILTSLKLKLNSEIKKTSSSKRRYILEYLFPYAVLEDYSPLVSYLLEHESDIPDVIMEKLLHDPTYSVFLTPSIKVNIYKSRKDYFMEDVEKEIKSLSSSISPCATVLDRCPNSDKGHIQPIFLENINPLSSASLLKMSGDESSLKTVICECLLKYATTSQISNDHQSQLYNLLFTLIKENHSILLPLSKEEISPVESTQITVYIKKLLNALSTVIDSDRTISKDPRRHGESDIYDPVTKLLFSLFKESQSVQPTPPESNPDLTVYTSKRSSLFLSCIEQMISHDYQRIFSAPVTDAIAPDYKDIIQHPMDLGTMKSRVSQYASVKDIQQDLDLIIANSEVYNGKNAPITQLGYELKRQWMKFLHQAEQQDKKLRAKYHIDTNLSSNTNSKAKPANSIAQKALPFLLLITAIAFSTPAFQSQLYRAIFQRIYNLCSKEIPPSDSGIVDPILYIYYQFLLLTFHIPDLVSLIRGESDYFPHSFFSTENKAESIQEYVEQAMFICQIIIYSQIKKELTDAELFSPLTLAHYRYLIYSSCSSQVCRMNDMNGTPAESEFDVLSNLYNMILKIDPSTLQNEWYWIESIIAAQIIKRVASIHSQLLSLLIERLLIPCMRESRLFSCAFRSFFTFLRCLKSCGLLTDDIISQISSSINQCGVQKHSIEDLDDGTKDLIKESTASVSDFRILFLQLLSDYSISSDFSYAKAVSPQAVEALPPPQSEKRPSPSYDYAQEESEDDFFYSCLLFKT